MHWGWGAGGGRARVSHARTRASVSARAQEMMSVEPQPDDFLTQRETGQSRATRMRGDRPYAQRQIRSEYGRTRSTRKRESTRFRRRIPFRIRTPAIANVRGPLTTLNIWYKSL